MKNSNNDNNSEEIRDLCLPYLEGLLSPDEKLLVDEHLNTDPDVSKTMSEIRQWSATLIDNKELFCPDIWELFDHTRRSKGSSSELMAHLDDCESCKEAVQSIASMTRKQRVPSELWDRMTGQDKVQPTLDRALEFLRNMASDYSEKLSQYFSMPVLAAGTVAAAVLIAILLWPSGHQAPFIGVSSEKWELSPLEKAVMGQVEPVPLPGSKAKNLTAVVVMFENFRHPMEQSEIDSLYKELKPTLKTRKLYRFVTPAELKQAVLDKKVSVNNKEELLRGLHTALDVDLAVLVTVTKDQDRYEVKSELIDSATGETIKTNVSQGVPGSKLLLETGTIGMSVLRP